MRKFYRLWLKQPLIISENTSSSDSGVLDHIPGSALLGAVAAKLYPQLSAEQSWQLFHNGEVKFGPAYPECVLAEGSEYSEISLPVPSSWHFAKLSKPLVAGQYQRESLLNHTDSQAVDVTVQYQQCRQGFVTSTGQAAQVSKGVTTKTALDRDSGGVKNGALFNYEYIEAGQSFIGWVDSPNAEVAEQIEQALLGDLRLGRSRGSEFGLVDVSALPLTAQPSVQGALQGELAIWCLSDCQVLNEFGLPSYTPSLGQLVSGAQGELDLSRSFIQSRQISRFNRARGGLDGTQHVISKGSVLVFTHVSLTAEQTAQLTQGVGLNQQQGLGWVAINPQWWQQGMLPTEAWFAPYQAVAPAQHHVDVALPDTPLFQWLTQKVAQNQGQDERNVQADQLAKALVQGYHQLRSYQRILHSKDAGPSSSQWGRVLDVLRNPSVQWLDELFADYSNKNSHAICKSANDPAGWGLDWYCAERKLRLSFAGFCHELFQAHTPEVVLLSLERLSRYKLCVYADLKRAAHELGLNAMEEQQ